MATKTISLKREAYDRLKAARRYPTESFSEVVLRATWPEDTVSARDLLTVYRDAGPRLPEAALDRIAAARRLDAPPGDKWANP
jgi:predicted CopG family antitoxin